MADDIARAERYQRLHQKRMLQAMRRKRRVTLFNKAHEFATKCDAHVYLLVRYGQDYYSYTSLEHPAWPPSPQQVVSTDGKLENNII
jgi:hypothetical protein